MTIFSFGIFVFRTNGCMYVSIFPRVQYSADTNIQKQFANLSFSLFLSLFVFCTIQRWHSGPTKNTRNAKKLWIYDSICLNVFFKFSSRLFFLNCNKYFLSNPRPINYRSINQSISVSLFLYASLCLSLCLCLSDSTDWIASTTTLPCGIDLSY